MRLHFNVVRCTMTEKEHLTAKEVGESEPPSQEIVIGVGGRNKEVLIL